MPVLFTDTNPGTALWSGDDDNTTGTATADINSSTGSVSSAIAGSGDSGDVNWSTGNVDMTGPFFGGDSGELSYKSGDTNSTDAGGTGGATGSVTVGSGSAKSTLGTSGISGSVTVSSGSSADGNSGTVFVKGGDAASGVQGVVQIDGLVTLAGVTGSAIAGATLLTLADSGGIFEVDQDAAFDIDLPAPTGPGLRYTFVLTDDGANVVTITTIGASTFVGTIANDVTSVLPATGATLTFANGVSAIGDTIEIFSISTTLYGVRAISSAAGGITIA